MYNAGGAARPAPVITQTPLLLSSLSLSLSWYFSQGVSPFHDWRNISSQSGLFCIKTTPHLHNLRVSSSLLMAASAGQTPRPPVLQSSSGSEEHTAPSSSLFFPAIFSFIHLT